jgi:hypothetical protein
LNYIFAAIQMTTGKANPLRESIRTTPAQRVGPLSADATAEATAATWRLVAAQLGPVIGARGLEVLFRRALHMTSTSYRWLAVSEGRGGSADQLPSIAECLARQDPATAAEASHKLLLRFTELLTTLIGESLTTRLLAPVFAGTAQAQESAL